MLTYHHYTRRLQQPGQAYNNKSRPPPPRQPMPVTTNTSECHHPPTTTTTTTPYVTTSLAHMFTTQCHTVTCHTYGQNNVKEAPQSCLYHYRLSQMSLAWVIWHQHHVGWKNACHQQHSRSPRHTPIIHSMSVTWHTILPTHHGNWDRRRNREKEGLGEKNREDM